MNGFRTRPVSIWAFAILGITLLSQSTARADVDVEDLQPGLIATFRDNAKPAHEVVRLEPTIALNLKAGEAPHPRLDAAGGTYVWKGYINLLRAGNYRFQAMLRGQLKITIDGKTVYDGKSTVPEPTLVVGDEVKLEAGGKTFVAEFTRLPGAARVELRWQAGHISLEPFPYHQVGHLPADVGATLKEATLIEKGRRLAEEANCIACHKPAADDRLAKGLSVRQGPILTEIGKRVYAGWLDAWLADPHKVRAGTPMPQMFTDDEAGRTERYAVARYLNSLGGPMRTGGGGRRPANPNEVLASERRGRQLFINTGCIVCHGSVEGEEIKPKGEQAPPSPLYAGPKVYPLVGLGSKTTPERLAEYLANPLAIDPSGRMPHMMLQGNEALDLARFLCKSAIVGIPSDLPAAPDKEKQFSAYRRIEDNKADSLAAFEKLSDSARWIELGQKIVIAKGCANCHTIAPNNKPLTQLPAKHDLESLKKLANKAAGCLASKDDTRGSAPNYRFTPDEVSALTAFLNVGLTGVGSPAPTYAAKAAIERFNCLACHSRDGAGGVSPELTEVLRRYEKPENAESLLPPTLTGVGMKMRTSWARQVLTQGGRARPWMGLRMPQFGEANIGHLVEGLSVLDGAAPDDTLHQVPLATAKIEAGRFLMGKAAFGCISCHDLDGNPTGGTRGADLATTVNRVRYDWYRRWLEQSQRMAPGTRMPSVFLNGKSPLDKVLNGDPNAQAEAMWAYMSLGHGLPLPDGMEIRGTKGIALKVEDRPVILRTFMPDAGTRSVAIGMPGGVSTAFDAGTCRMTYAWSGAFLDASPVWNDRGGAPAKVLGAKFWTAPPGCSLGLTSSSEPPDFAARAKDPAYGAGLPEGQVFAGQPMLRFAGYSLDKEGVPTFRYRLKLEEEREAEILEKGVPLKSPAGPGIGRRFEVSAPSGQLIWLQAGTATREPRVLDAKGEPVAVDFKVDPVEIPAVGKSLLLPQDGDKVLILKPTDLPEGAAWQFRKQGSGWQILLRVPPPAVVGKQTLGINVWSPYRDEATLIREIVVGK